MSDAEIKFEGNNQVGSNETTLSKTAEEPIKPSRVLEFTFEGEKTQNLSLKEAVIGNIVVGVIALAIYFPIEYQQFRLFHRYHCLAPHRPLRYSPGGGPFRYYASF